MPSSTDAHAGQAVYTRRALKLYDLVVLGISNRWIWKCPTPKLLDFYNQHISGNHLDVGVGTGYFLDHCHFPTSTPRIELLDLNSDCLGSTAQRISRYKPVQHQANVLEPLAIKTQAFDSIGLNYLLHCLPGAMESKAIAFDHLIPFLSKDGTVFGSTLVQRDAPRNVAAKRLMAFYNTRGIFGNSDDSAKALEAELDKRFEEYSVTLCGCVALFHAQGAKTE